jgi:predicted nuclease of restriction endonuclease-like (RecB) superfamily
VAVATHFRLPWSHYVRLLSVRNLEAHRFYEEEALRGGWTIRQLDRPIGSQFHERTALSRNKASMLRRGRAKTAGMVVHDMLSFIPFHRADFWRTTGWAIS